jgi:DNA repair protein RecO (recombination protein O)
MQWHDEAIILGSRRHGETSVILETMTRAHGRHLGLVRGGRSLRRQPILQAGNSVSLVWRARLDEHLGHYTVEGTALRAARFMASPVALNGLGVVAALLRLLPERDPHPALFEALTVMTEHLDDADLAPALLVRFELAMLGELGFGLDLTSCAATGATQQLIYVSPKSGRAVSAGAGEPYRDKLFALPPFLRDGFVDREPTTDEIRAAFMLTGHFLAKDVFAPRGLSLPDARAALIGMLGRVTS